MNDTDTTRDADRAPVAIVTGGSRGLGQALAAGLVAAGWQVVIDGRDAGALAAARTTILTATATATATSAVAGAGGGTAGDRLVAVAGDVTDPGHRAELVAAAERLGGVELVVNNAGILGPSPQPALAAYPLAALREVYEVNVVAPLALTQLALPGLRERGGAVVVVSSDAAVEPYPGWGGYGSAKAAAEQAGAVLAAEEPAVRVWVVDPGDLRTRMHQEAFPGEDISDRPLPETMVPAFLRLLAERPASGRVVLKDLVLEEPA